MKALFFSFFLLVSTFSFSQAEDPIVIHFDVDKSELREDARALLEPQLGRWKANPPLAIHLAGHCDFTGSEFYNDRLSKKRVAAVEDYLIRHGIPAAIIRGATGYGESRPLGDNQTEEGRQANRRVEITVVMAGPDIEERETVKKDNRSLTEKLTDSTAKQGSSVVLENIYFYGGMHRLLPGSLPVLEELLTVLKANPTLKIEIQGHICCQPGPWDGMDVETRVQNLSEARSKAIREHLITNGIDAGRVTAIGFGHSQPVYEYPEQSEEERVANRRVEIKIVSR